MLDTVNGSIVGAAGGELSNSVVSAGADSGFDDVFIKNVSGKYIIGCETYNMHSFWADGIDWRLRTCEYKNGAFIDKADISATGSYFEDEELAGYVDQVRSAGFSVNKAFDRISQNTSQLNAICTVEFAYTGDYDEYWKIVTGGKKGSLSPIQIDIQIP